MQATQVSQEPIVCASDVNVHGFHKGFLTVGSYHLVETAKGLQLWLFMGEGDKYSCLYKVDIQGISWVNLHQAETANQDAQKIVAFAID